MYKKLRFLFSPPFEGRGIKRGGVKSPLQESPSPLWEGVPPKAGGNAPNSRRYALLRGKNFVQKDTAIIQVISVF
jgi:hypothetical protein